MKDNDKDTDIVIATIRAGQSHIEDKMGQIRHDFYKEHKVDPSMPSLLYGMASSILETIYACAPDKEEAERIINMALTTAQENVGEYNRLIKEMEDKLDEEEL